MHLVVFSVITPSMNQLGWLRQCILSVRNQVLQSPTSAHEEQGILEHTPLPNISPPPSATGAMFPAPSMPPQDLFSIEHIIQDAGTPGIEDLARELGAEFHRNGHLIFEARPSTIYRNAALKIFSEPDAGMYDAINKGLLKSSGEICSCLNCDEQYISGAMTHILEAVKANPTKDAFFGDFVVIDQNNNPLCYRRCFAQDPSYLLFSSLNIASCTLFFRRTVVDSGFLFDPEWKIIGDKVWILNLFQAGFRFHATRKLVACFRLLASNLSNKPLAIFEEKIFAKQCKKINKYKYFFMKISQVATKFLAGCYLPRRVDFKISDATERGVRVGPKWISFLWPKTT